MKLISSSRKAYYDYEILKEYIAGISLKGHEVKSIKLGKVNIKGSYVRVIKSELYIIGMNVSKYNDVGKELRDRKLLLNKREIKDISEKIKSRGLTAVALAVMLSKGLVKVKIALARGKKNYDKRASLKNKSVKRELERYTKHRS